MNPLDTTKDLARRLKIKPPSMANDDLTIVLTLLTAMMDRIEALEKGG